MQTKLLKITSINLTMHVKTMEYHTISCNTTQNDNLKILRHLYCILEMLSICPCRSQTISRAVLDDRLKNIQHSKYDNYLPFSYNGLTDASFLFVASHVPWILPLATNGNWVFQENILSLVQGSTTWQTFSDPEVTQNYFLLRETVPQERERGKRKRKEERGKRKRKEEIERGKRKRKEKEERERAKRKRKE